MEIFLWKGIEKISECIGIVQMGNTITIKQILASNAKLIIVIIVKKKSSATNVPQKITILSTQ